jgi:hypothetical protein
MKKVKISGIVIALMLLSSAAYAQKINYTYDTAGNRVGCEVEQQEEFVQDTLKQEEFFTTENMPQEDEGIQAVLSIRTYPNPVVSVMQVDLQGLKPGESGTLRIYTISGVLLYQQKYLDVSQTIDLSGFASGHYIVNVKAGKKTTLAHVLKL